VMVGAAKLLSENNAKVTLTMILLKVITFSWFLIDGLKFKKYKFVSVLAVSEDLSSQLDIREKAYKGFF